MHAAGRTPALYLVFEDGADGLRMIHRREVELAAPLPSLSEAGLRGAERRAAPRGRGVSVTLTDASRRVVFRQHLELPEWVRGEFHGEPEGPGWRIDAHAFRAETRVFAVRVPVGVGRELRVQARDRAAVVDLAAPAPAGDATAPLAVASTASTGSPANRLDLLVIGDGYTDAEQADFEADAAAIEQSFLGVSPYAPYRSYVNLHRLFVPSQQSGADHPPYDPACSSNDPTCCADPDAGNDPLAGSYVNTAFDARFCAFNIHRLLVTDPSKVLVAAGAVPDADHVLVIVNDAEYGGSGGIFATFSMHAQAIHVARHEFGHSFTGLADEYGSPYPEYPSCSDVSGFSPCEANATDVTSPATLKWMPWVAPSTPLPTPQDDLTYQSVVGLFEGARYLASGMYRPRQFCGMQLLGVPFCQICRQAYVMRLYQGGWGIPANGIDPIEPGSESPPPGAVSTPPCEIPFSFELLERVSGPAAEVTWRVEGQPIPAARESLLFFPERTGLIEIELETLDTTALVHPDLALGALSSSRSWSVDVASGSCPDRCGNGVDDDGDGGVDFPADPGCNSPSDPDERSMFGECDDGVDDDGDGASDFRPGGDPGCENAADGSELSTRECDNGVDDDSDGRIDWRPDGSGDFECFGSTDNFEATHAVGSGCGLGPELIVLPGLLLAARRARRRT
jgi:hypothetical protein